MISAKSPRSAIREYQSQLQRAGLYFGDVDGLWGPKTQRAHEAYQAIGNPPDPIAGRGVIADITKRILDEAATFVGLTETSPNRVWDNLATGGKDAAAVDLLKKLKDAAWQPGWAYCIAFGEVVWRAGYRNRPELPLITQAITVSVMSTYENFAELKRVSLEPKPGALMLLQNGTSWQGHAEIVERVEGSRVFTIGANTGPQAGSANERDGDGVYRKSHLLNFAKKNKGLWLRGFVNPFTV